MRQIQVCAWYLVIAVAGAACSGEKFSPSEGGSPNGPASSANGGSGNYAALGGSASTTPDDASDGGASEVASPPQRGGGAGSGNASAGTYSGASGGNASGGGNSSGSGNAGGTTPTPSECAVGNVTFKMVPDGNLPHDYLCDAGCGTGWLSITDAVGATAYSLFSACGVASCETCEVQTCVASACLPMPLTGEGSQLSWNGSYFTKDTCGQHLACQAPACVKPGKYKAKACAAINAGSSSMNAGCAPKNEMLCAEAEFEFPGTKSVTLTLKK
jgi:hypothetical protein